MTGWDMHRDPLPVVPQDFELASGTRIEGSVICHHPYGFGVRLPSVDQYGHVDITEVSEGTVLGEDDFPPIGEALALTVIGYTEIGRQLRLSAKR
jgi:predicted RNA-binding protein with RPS1 domain